MLLSEHKNSRFQGSAGLGSAIDFFTRSGFVVSIPLNDSQGYDLIIDIKGDLKKVQVKTTCSKAPSGAYSVSLRTTGGNQSFSYAKPFDNKKCDILFILTKSSEKYIIPTEKIKNINRINLSGKYLEYRVDYG